MNHYLFRGLQASPKIVAAFAREVSPRRYDEKVDPDRFSFREAVAHLADWEVVFHERIRLGAQHPGATLITYEPDDRAAEHGYESADVERSAALFAERRAFTVELAHGLSQDQWSNALEHPEHGRMTIYELLNMMIGHDLDHLEHLSRYLGEKTVSTW